MAEKMTEDVVYADVVFVKRNKAEKDDPDHSDLATKSKACCDSVRLLLLVLCVFIAGGLIALSVQYVYKEKKLRDSEVLRNVLEENFTEISAVLQDMHNQLQNLSKALKGTVCPKGWEYHAGKCYFFSTNELVWNKSRDACITDGGHLVIINNEDEQKFLLRILTNKYHHSFWIGLTDQEKEAKWLWVDNTELTNKRYWIYNEPDNWRKDDPDGENCARIEKNDNYLQTWFDVSCKTSFRRICETKSPLQT